MGTWLLNYMRTPCIQGSVHKVGILCVRTEWKEGPEDEGNNAVWKQVAVLRVGVVKKSLIAGPVKCLPWHDSRPLQAP